MKSLITILLIFLSNWSSGQIWSSIHELNTYGRAAYEQFIIDPYSNKIWFIAGDQVSVIENDGNVRVFTPSSGEISSLWLWNEMRFAFTADHTYFSNDDLGLYNFDNYTEQLVYNLSGSNEFLNSISSNNDTVYLAFHPDPFSYAWSYVNYTPSSGSYQTGKVCDLVVAKGTQKYLVESDYFLSYSFGDELLDPSFYLIANSQVNHDPDYIGGRIHDLKFQRIGDTLFVAGPNGISVVYNYDLLPINYTPFNTTNMPSQNVLEIEFDESDSLWAVFGDQNDDPFAIAKLDGTNWTSIFDANNSPIDFTTFYGLEIDTLGNLWVNDENYLHTLLNANSPQWLNTIANKLVTFDIYPNPSHGAVHVSLDPTVTVDRIELHDVTGRIVFISDFQSDLELNVPSGIYFVHLMDGTSILGSKRIVVR